MKPLMYFAETHPDQCASTTYISKIFTSSFGIISLFDTMWSALQVVFIANFSIHQRTDQAPDKSIIIYSHT